MPAGMVFGVVRPGHQLSYTAGMTKGRKKAAEDDQPDFESSITELEQLVEKMEKGELSLNESLSHFERGVTLSRQCHRMLEEARQAVTVLTDPDQADSEQPFVPGGESM